MNHSIPSGLRQAPRLLRRLTAGQVLRHTAVVLSLLLWAGSPAVAQVSVSIGINMPVYPQLVRVPNYPVYYAPAAQTNFFFYDGMYWVYQHDNWYGSSWYNGPWRLVSPQAVPLYVLRIPVRYYRNPPMYFRGWRPDAPPRWGEHWGNEWSQQRSGWDRWDRRAAPAPAPLPVYQRQYSGDRYPPVEQQQVLQSRNYRYQPRDAVVRQSYQQPVAPPTAAPSPQYRRPVAPPAAPDIQFRPAVPNRPQQQQGVDLRQPQQVQQQPQQLQKGAERRQPEAPGANDRGPPAGHAAVPGPAQGQRQGQGRGNDKAKGQEHDRDNEQDGGRQGKK